MHVVELCRLGTSRNLLLSPLLLSPYENFYCYYTENKSILQPIKDRVDWLRENIHELRLEETTDIEYRSQDYWAFYWSAGGLSYNEYMKKVCSHRAWLLYTVLSTEQLVEYNLVFGGE